jgi:hypothetical protein
VSGPEVRRSRDGWNKPSRWHWLLMPLTSVLTILLLAGTTELIARRVFKESNTGLSNCLIFSDPSTGVRGIPNSVCREKSAEGQWIEYRLNSCGYRAGMECGPKPPDTFRIVLTGSSQALGERVQREESFAARLPMQLSQLTGLKVQLYNESMGFGFSHNTALRFHDALAEQPDLVLWLLTPTDVANGSFVLPTIDPVNPHSAGLARKAWERVRTYFASESVGNAASEVFDRTRTALLIRHYLYESQSQYLKSVMAGPDEIQGYLKATTSQTWKLRLRQFESRTRAAGIPLVAVYIPSRAQAAMISVGTWPADFDPYKLNEQLREIIVSHGGTYIDISPDFRDIPHPERYYFPVDGHPNVDGHALLTYLLTQALTGGAVPALKPDVPRAVRVQGRG